MNTKPIIFGAPMIRALLDGRKAQTRRVVKPQPADGKHLEGWVIDSTNAKDIGKACWGRGCGALSYDNERIRCPYGQAGDLLWVRESFSRHPQFADVAYRANDDGDGFEDSDGFLWEPSYKPSIHMPRTLSRLTLQITDVRVQRLQDISEADACAEGLRVFNEDDAILYYSALATEAEWPAGWHLNPVDAFRELWQSINGPESWDVNPWVWALSFRVIHANVDAVLADPAAHGAEVRNAA